MAKRLIIVQTTVADYRVPLFVKVKAALKEDFKVFCGERFFDPTIKIDYGFQPDKLLKNQFFLKDRLLWQHGIVGSILKNDLLILSLNPRVLSNWVVLILRRLFNRKTIIWGHAWPKEGRNSKTESVRHLMRTLADKIIVYTHAQKAELQVRMPSATIIVAPNALYSRNEMRSDTILMPLNIIYVGRITREKKVSLLYDGFKMGLSELPPESKLIIIGDGPERSAIGKKVREDNLEDRVIMPGSISKIDELYNYYKTCLISVSPGRVGLSLIQSLAFGVHMVIAKNELHGPELEAANNNTARFFKENNSRSLSEAILECFHEKEVILSKRSIICGFCKDNYSLESMASVFINLIKRRDSA